MADLALGVAGAAIAGIPGLGVTALQGFQIGATLGGMLFPQTGPAQERGRISEVRVNSASQGTPLPIVYGRARLPGIILWLSELRESKESTRVGGKGGQSVSDFEYHVDIALALCEGPIQSIRRIWANTDVIYDATGGPAEYEEFWDSDDLDIYLGTESQVVNDLMEAAVGVGECPAYRGIAYLVFRNFPITRYSNAIPQFSVEIDADTSLTVDAMLVDLLGKAGVASSDIDATALSSDYVLGKVIDGRAELRDPLRSLQERHKFDLVEHSGKIIARKWGEASARTLDADHLGRISDHSPVSLTRRQDAELPMRAEVRYVSEACDLQPAVQRAEMEAAPTEDHLRREYSSLMTEDEAKRLAITLLLREWVQRLGGQAAALPRLLELAPGDILTVPTLIGELTFKVQGMSIAPDGMLELALVEDDATIYTQTASGAEVECSGEPSGLDGASTFEFAIRPDLPALDDSDADRQRAYIWAAREKKAWEGAKWITDRTWEAQWDDDEVKSLSSCIFGTTSTTMAAAPNVHVWDDTTTVDVTVHQGSLASATDEEVLNGANLCIIGGEVLQFGTATLIAASTYRMSRLLRGRRGTESEAAASKASGADFLLLTGSVLKPAARMRSFLNTGNQGGFDLYEPSIDGRQDENFNIYDSILRPYAPCHLKVDVDGSGDRIITWIRRVRKNGELVDGIDAPLDYDSERHALAIGASGASEHGDFRAFGFTSNHLILGADTGDRYPDLSTALSAATYTVPSATWTGWGGGDMKIMVAQIGLIDAQGYRAIGKPATITGGA